MNLFKLKAVSTLSDEDNPDDTLKKHIIDLGNASEVIHFRRFIPLDQSWMWFDYLNKHIPWTRPILRVFGRSCIQPRDMCYVAAPGLTELSYSGYQPHAYSWDDYPPLKDILGAVHKALPGSSFNSILLNRYKGGNDYVGWHADDEKLYGPAPEIASLSFGCEREFILKRKPSKRSNDVCVVGVARTPIGAFLGTLSSISATELGSIAIKSALKRANVDPSLVQEVFFGNVLAANLGQAPARQAALGAGIPSSVICTTINKVCSAGIKATMLAALTIQSGIHDVVVVGGMESMSNAPKYMVQARKGSRVGHDTIVDGMIKDGLWDVYNDFGMGVCAELCADLHDITREEQDSYAIESYGRAISAQNSGHFTWEIVPVEVSAGRGKSFTFIDKDECLGKFDAAKLKKLRPSFKEDLGSVTAGNASSISDGAAALVLVSGEKVLQLGLQVIAKIKGYADAAQAPEVFTTAPALAIPKAISNSGLEASQIDYYEINEAFSVVVLANQKLLGLNPEKVNVHGGAVALGHPLGCSGARILVTLLGVLRQKKGKYGVATICNGGGGASALVFEHM
ncbi:probable acetyl-CoA acetyltransferase, cytosolic 2 isoform X3 [Neltuma alba]|nr:probable acetyl-CoA acetyltransferase, cytosolic 2 isoform X3 [Prosopis alba]